MTTSFRVKQVEHTVRNVFKLSGRTGAVLEWNGMAYFLAQDATDFCGHAARLRACNDATICKTCFR